MNQKHRTQKSTPLCWKSFLFLPVLFVFVPTALWGQCKLTIPSDNLSNRRIEEALADGSQVLRQYNEYGRLASITPPERSAHLFEYAKENFLARYLPPKLSSQSPLEVGSLHYKWNLQGAIEQIDGDGWTLKYQYHTRSGLLETIQSPRGRTQFFYQEHEGSKLNQVKEAISPDKVVQKMSYLGPYLQTIHTYGGVPLSLLQFEYDQNQRIKGLVLNGGRTINFKYNGDGWVIEAGDETIQRNSSGQPTEVFAGAIRKSLVYDAQGLVQSEIYQSSTVTLAQIFQRDSSTRIVAFETKLFVAKNAEAEGSDTENVIKQYKYDKRGRLVSITKNGNPLHRYFYDSNGMRSENHPIESLKFDEQDRLTRQQKESHAILTDYNRDGSVSNVAENDSQLQIKNKFSFQWEPLGRLMGVEIFSLSNPSTSKIEYASSKIEYILDAFGRRVGKKKNGALVKTWVYQDQHKLLAEMDGHGQILWQFVYGTKWNIPDLAIGHGKTYFIVSNHIGTPQFLLDTDSGEIEARFAFDEWGKELAPPAKAFELPFGFAGGLWDRDTHLVHFGHREYSPNLGHWLSKDPIGFGGGDTNLYSYAGNDPINYIDLKGTDRTHYDWGVNGRWGPRNGNWGGENWSGGVVPSTQDGFDGQRDSLDSGDECYRHHDNCYNACGMEVRKFCDAALMSCLKTLSNDSRKWPRPPRPGTEADSEEFRQRALRWFGAKVVGYWHGTSFVW